MVNNFARDNTVRLTFGNLESKISSSENPSSEISLAFTPTTLALIEHNFVEFGGSLAMPKQMERNSIPGAWDHSASYSGMSDCSDDSNDASFGAEWTAGQNQMKLCDNSVSTTGAAADARPVRRLPGPRPSCRDEEMTPEELERRKRRRERNKHAAAKCRQRRVDQTNELLEETKSLEQESQKLQKEIETLERLKHQLEFVLEAHKPSCKADVAINQYPVLKVEPCSNIAPTSHPAQRPTSLPIATTTTPSSASMLVSTSASHLSFDFPLTGLTPLGDPAALFASLDGTSPSAILLSPSSLLI